jgi:glycosyltransferase involved in cell wall biosynthesis
MEQASLAQQPAGSAPAPLAGPEPTSISVCIICRNEADKLPACLASVIWADEILVLDLNSADGSAATAAAYGARVLTREPYPIVEPLRNEIAAAARGAWVLALDPDERITPGLARELRRLAQRQDLDAIVIPRMNWDLGYPPSSPTQRYEPQLRMYRRSAVAWPLVPNALPNVPEARKHRLPDHDDLVMVHERNRSIPEVLERISRYAPAQAQSMIDAGQTFSARHMLVALSMEIYKHFFWGRAWRDGVPGLLRAGILVGYKFYVWAAFWQLSGAGRAPADDRLLGRIDRVSELIRFGLGVGRAVYRAGLGLTQLFRL